MVSGAEVVGNPRQENFKVRTGDPPKYVAPRANGRMGTIEARSEKTGKNRWDAVIYKVKEAKTK
jgi:hypothetical protein